MNVIDYLNIPKAGVMHQRIAIKSIVDAHNLSYSEEKLLRDHISSIYLIGALNESTINVRTHKDEDMIYEEIHILDIQLKQDKKFVLLNQKLHALFPNPVLIIFTHDVRYTFSTAIKHINKYEPNQAVVEELFISEKFKLKDNSSEEFLKRLDLKTIHFNNLKDYYNELVNIIYQQRLINVLGSYPENIINALKVKEALKELEQHQLELNKIKEQAIPLQTMRSKMENHMQQKKIEEKIESIITKIKEAV